MWRELFLFVWKGAKSFVLSSNLAFSPALSSLPSSPPAPFSYFVSTSFFLVPKREQGQQPERKTESSKAAQPFFSSWLYLIALFQKFNEGWRFSLVTYIINIHFTEIIIQVADDGIILCPHKFTLNPVCLLSVLMNTQGQKEETTDWGKQLFKDIFVDNLVRIYFSQVWCHVPLIPVVWEAETERSQLGAQSEQFSDLVRLSQK